jgi:PAS domain S-box-containing protein
MEAICNVMEFYKHLANAYYLNKYDVLLLDYRIPQENALEILNKIRISSYSDIPVILVTGKGDEEIAVNALKSGAFDYITKSQGYLFKLPSVIENAHYSSQLARKHEALLESENRYRSLFEKNHVAMLLIDPVNGDIIDANSAAVLFYGWSKAQLISKKIFAVNTCNPEKTEAELQDVANEINTHFFLKHRRADDSICDVEVYRGAIVIMGRSLVYSMVYDISERIKTQKEKKELQKKLIQAQKMEAVGQLAGGIAHDFNNILSSILGFTELALTEVELGTTIEKDLQEVYTAGQRAKDLVKQILSFARQSDNILKPIRVDIIVKEVLNFIRASIPASIEIKSILSSHSLVLGDSTQIYQVLMNLCTNAAQAMENNGGKLTIDLQDVTIKNNSSVTEFSLKPGNYIKLRVADTGMGITSNIIESIFEPYFTTKSAGMGTGMGLAVVHRIIEDHKGKIIVTSETEKGSVFTIWLPISEKQPSRQIYKSEELPTGTEHLLFVDDEVPIVKVFTRILENLGYSITGTTSSTEALGLFRARPDNFDLVITDMTMPDMNGDALAKKIISLRPDIPIILCTGYSKMISRSTAFEIGIKALVHKPIVRADLAKAIRKAIDQAQDSF